METSGRRTAIGPDNQIMGTHVTVDLSRLYYKNEPFPRHEVHPKTGAVAGDWDLRCRSVSELDFLFGCQNCRHPDWSHAVLLPSSESSGDGFREGCIEVAVGREGDLVAVGGWPSLLRHLGKRGQNAPARVIGRHPRWIAFREELANLAAAEAGSLYAPVEHPDLQFLPSWNDGERWEAISRCISPQSHTVLDIGANLGYMAFKVQASGRQCTAVEVDDTYFYFLDKLRRASSSDFIAVKQDIFEFVEQEQKFDAVLSLAVFHHFVKTRARHKQLIQLLRTLQMREMFFWSHNPAEEQMQDAYRNYQPDEFVQFIKDNSCLNHSVKIAEIEFRELFHLWR
jgi:hypothetical protein